MLENENNRIRLIPINENQDLYCRREFQKHSLLTSPEKFIYLVNTKSIPTEDSSLVKQMLQLLKGSYINLVYWKDRIEIISEERAAIYGIQELLDKMVIAIKLKELAANLIEQGSDPNEYIIFKRGHPFPYVVHPENDKKLFRLKPEDSPFGWNDLVEECPFLWSIQEVHPENNDFLIFRLSTIMKLDTSFPIELKDYLLKQSQERGSHE